MRVGYPRIHLRAGFPQFRVVPLATATGFDGASCFEGKYVILDIEIVPQPSEKPIVWLKGEVKSPPFSPAARLEAGLLLRRLQRGEAFGLPHSRPMPSIGDRCHELRIRDRERSWRIVYHVADDAIAILEVFSKKTRATPPHVVEVCRKRLASFVKAAANREQP